MKADAGPDRDTTMIDGSRRELLVNWRAAISTRCSESETLRKGGRRSPNFGPKIAYSSIIAARATGAMNSIVRSRYCISASRATFSVSFGLSMFFTKAGAWLGAMDDRARSLSRA